MRRFVAALVLLFVPFTAFAQLDNLGTEFWLAFPGNFSTPELTLFITSGVDTSGTVSIPSLAFNQAFNVTGGTIISVAIPSAADIQTTDVVESLGIHVVANNEVAVYGLNRVTATTDAYLGLPVDVMGTNYRVLSYVPAFATSQFVVVGTEDGTVVTITPSANAGARTAGVPYNINLNEGQTYQLRSTTDLTGSIVTSTKPVAVFGSNQCTQVPLGTAACDHLVEQLPPTDSWGQRYISVPLATRTAGDIFRILASENGTVVTINGANVATLAAGQFHETSLSVASEFTSNNPILVAQYSKGSNADGVVSDPFMMLINPAEQFLASYVITTPAAGFATNFVNLVAPAAAVGTITLDGVVIPAASFSPIGTTGYSGAQVPISIGAHTLSGSAPFGVFVYGFDSFDSYGYSGGGLNAPVALANSIDLAPATATTVVGTEHCVTATVRDSSNQPVVGVRVDFVVTGANEASGFALTSADGTAQFCYTGANAGTDTISASLGTLTANATNEQTEEAVPPGDIPTLSQWALILLGLALVGIAALRISS